MDAAQFGDFPHINPKAISAFQPCINMFNDLTHSVSNAIIQRLKRLDSKQSVDEMVSEMPKLPPQMVECFNKFVSFDLATRNALIQLLEFKHVPAKINQVFSQSMFNIVYELRNGGKINIKISSTINNSVCLTLTIDLNRHRITIDGLDKCSSGKGPALLNAVYALALSLEINYIDLIDASNTYVCDVPTDLAVLKILTTGQSWYNAYGYYSDNHAEDVAYNKTIINAPFVKFIHIFPEDLIEELKRVFPEIEITHDITFTDYVNELLKLTGRDETCDGEKAKTLTKLVNCVAKDRFLNYEVYLQRIVERHRVGGKGMLTKGNKKCNKKSNKKCNKKSNKKCNNKRNTK